MFLSWEMRHREVTNSKIVERFEISFVTTFALNLAKEPYLEKATIENVCVCMCSFYIEMVLLFSECLIAFPKDPGNMHLRLFILSDFCSHTDECHHRMVSVLIPDTLHFPPATDDREQGE